MQDAEWYFDSEDSTVSTTIGDLELEICKVANFDLYESNGIYGGKYYFGEKSKANAALLTSAPALLQSLEELLSRYTGLINCGDAGDWNPEEEDEVIKARAAIAAARGE